MLLGYKCTYTGIHHYDHLFLWLDGILDLKVPVLTFFGVHFHELSVVRTPVHENTFTLFGEKYIMSFSGT